MPKVVINRCFGGFGLTEAAFEYMGIPWDGCGHAGEIPRDDSKLVACAEALGISADGTFARLKVVEIPDDIRWEITEYDGMETVEEIHRSWS